MAQLLKPSLLVRSIFNRGPTNRWTISANSASVFNVATSSRLYTSQSSADKTSSSSDHVSKKKKLKADRAYDASAVKSVLGTKTYNKVMGIVDKEEYERHAEEKRRFEVRKESNKLVSGNCNLIQLRSKRKLF